MKRETVLRAIVTYTWIAALCATQAQAQPAHIAVRPWASNILVPQARGRSMDEHRHQPIRITQIEARIDLVEGTATTTLEIRLENTSGSRQEAELVVPVPDGAVVRGFAYDGPDGRITAQVLPKDQARRIYQQLVSKIRDPALVEFIGYNLIRSSVFPVEAHGKQRVRLTYEHLPAVEGNRIDYCLPRSESLQYDVPWTITARIQSKARISTVYSPSHEVFTSRTGDHDIKVKIESRQGAKPGPFRLSVLLEKDDVTATVFAYPDPAVGGGHFLLLAGVPATAPRSDIRREVTLVIDRSGSMRNEKIAQVREAALQILAGLKGGEAFNVILYSNTVEAFSERPVIKDRDTEAAARAYIEGITASGGTNIHDALLKALAQDPTDGMLPIVLFLTDGLPTVGQTSEVAIRDLVTKDNPHKRRVFTFGVGLDVNAALLEKLADLSRARAQFVLPDEDVEVKVGKVFAGLAGPVLAEPLLQVLDKDGRPALGRTRDILPATLPDLFEGDQLVVLGQYVGAEPMTIQIRGKARHKEQTFAVRFDPAQADPAHGFVPRLWASRKIAELIDLVRQMGADSAVSGNDPKVKELTEEIVRLSMQYGILTEYTAFLAREGTDLADAIHVNNQARARLEERALRSRSGGTGVVQSLNSVQMKSQAYLNADNAYLNDRMEAERFTSIQQTNDLAFYRRGPRWIDSRLARQQTDPHIDRTITAYSPEYFELAERLARHGRQAGLALDGDVVLVVDGQTILVTAGQ